MWLNASSPKKIEEERGLTVLRRTCDRLRYFYNKLIRIAPIVSLEWNEDANFCHIYFFMQ